jgi:hypothetical protein
MVLVANLLFFITTASAQEQNIAWQTEFIDLTITLDPGRGIIRGDAGLQLKNLGTGNENILLTLNHQLRDVYRVKDEIAFKKGPFRDSRTVEINARATKLSFLLSFKPQIVHFDQDYKILRWTEQF